jgi:hypothetical protein
MAGGHGVKLAHTARGRNLSILSQISAALG